MSFLFLKVTEIDAVRHSSVIILRTNIPLPDGNNLSIQIDLGGESPRSFILNNFPQLIDMMPEESPHDENADSEYCSTSPSWTPRASRAVLNSAEVNPNVTDAALRRILGMDSMDEAIPEPPREPPRVPVETQAARIARIGREQEVARQRLRGRPASALTLDELDDV